MQTCLEVFRSFFRSFPKICAWDWLKGRHSLNLLTFRTNKQNIGHIFTKRDKMEFPIDSKTHSASASRCHFLHTVRKIMFIGRLPTFGFVNQKIKAAHNVSVHPYGRGVSPASRPSTQHTYGARYIHWIVKNEPSAWSQRFESVWSVWLSLAVDINKLQGRSSVFTCVGVCWEIRNSTA